MLLMCLLLCRAAVQTPCDQVQQREKGTSESCWGRLPLRAVSSAVFLHLPAWETLTASLRVKFRPPPKGLSWGVGCVCLLVPDGDRPFPAAWGAEFGISSGDEEGCFDVLTDPETSEEALNVTKGKPHGRSTGRVTAVHTRRQSARPPGERAAASRLPPPK